MKPENKLPKPILFLFLPEHAMVLLNVQQEVTPKRRQIRHTINRKRGSGKDLNSITKETEKENVVALDTAATMVRATKRRDEGMKEDEATAAAERKKR